MNNRQTHHNTLREWLYLESDGELNAVQRSSLKQHLESCSECREELRQVDNLERLLVASRIEVGESFRDEVMSGLPSAGWEARAPRTWIAAAVVALLFALGSALLIGGASEQATSAVPIAALSAIWDLLATSALAGAGLLAASWKGLGLAMQDVLGQSIWNVVAFGALVLCLDILLLRYLLRDRTAKAESETSRDS